MVAKIHRKELEYELIWFANEMELAEARERKKKKRKKQYADFGPRCCILFELKC